MPRSWVQGRLKLRGTLLPLSSLPPPHASHSFPSPSQSHLLSLKAAGGANMYVMNISSPERGLAGELRSPGEGALPSRAGKEGA